MNNGNENNINTCPQNIHRHPKTNFRNIGLRVQFEKHCYWLFSDACKKLTGFFRVETWLRAVFKRERWGGWGEDTSSQFVWDCRVQHECQAAWKAQEQSNDKELCGRAAEWSVRRTVQNRSQPCSDMCPKEQSMKGGSGHPRTDGETSHTGRSGMAIRVMMLLRASLHFDHWGQHILPS